MREVIEMTMGWGEIVSPLPKIVERSVVDIE